MIPILYFQGKKLRANIPSLPDAKGPSGMINQNSTETIRIVFIGESTIAGVGVNTHEEGFAGTFSSLSGELTEKNIQWDVYAKSGYTCKNVLYKVLPQLPDKLDVIIVGTGGNDAFKLNSLKKWNHGINTLIEKLTQKYPSTIIGFTNMPPIKEFPAFTRTMKFVLGNLVQLFGVHLAEVVKNYDRVFYNEEVISLQAWLKKYNQTGSPVNYFSDGLHPSKITYQVWAKDFLNFLSQKELFLNKLQS